MESIDPSFINFKEEESGRIARSVHEDHLKNFLSDIPSEWPESIYEDNTLNKTSTRPELKFLKKLKELSHQSRRFKRESCKQVSVLRCFDFRIIHPFFFFNNAPGPKKLR